ncbi:MAG: hypothetical protein KatS3mg027_2100 [Bacteroidia bacterium]|nr:MAG: hypothetical protein KatS3mg027_2100 [Bacteroidia bacterium]
MKKILTNILFLITILTHPIFLPIYLSIWFFFSRSNQVPVVYLYFIPMQLKFKWSLLYTSLTTALPLIILFMAKIFKMIDKITLESVRDRRYFFLLIGVYYWFLFYMFRELYAREFFRPTIVLIGVMSVVMFISSLLSSSLFKISVHAAGYGVLTGFFVSLTLIYKSFFLPEIYDCIIISSFVMLLRLITKAHTFAELLIGWTMGLISTILIFTTIYNIY